MTDFLTDFWCFHILSNSHYLSKELKTDMMQRSLTDFVDNRKQNSNTNNRFLTNNDFMGSGLDSIDTNNYMSSYITRTDSNGNNLTGSVDSLDFFSYNKNIPNNSSSLVVPLTPIGCNKSSLNVSSSSSNVNNLFGKYLMNKKLNNLKQQHSSKAVSSLNLESDKMTPASTAGSSFIGDVSSFDNDDDREFFQSITKANSNNSNSNYYYNSNSAISRGSFLDNELFNAENSNSDFQYNNDVEDLMLDDTLNQIYNANENGTYNNNYNNEDVEELNYTINPMITQINPKQFVSSDYDVQNIDLLLQEAEELEQTAISHRNSKKHISAVKPVGDYNIFIKGDDGVELPVQEVLKNFKFNLSDSATNSNAVNTHVNNMPSNLLSSSLSPPSASVSNPNNWNYKSSPLVNSSSNSFAILNDVIGESIDSSQLNEEEDSISKTQIASMVNPILRDEKNKASVNSEEYKCEHASCKKSFSRPYDLVRHTKTIHSKQKKLYRCLICIKELGDLEGHKKTFSRGDALSRHIKLKHELKIGDESLRFAMKFAKENVEYVEN